MEYWRNLAMYKTDFPIFTHNPNLVYLDSAATTHKPQVVIDAVSAFYSHSYATTHRGLYPLAQHATDAFEDVRKKISHFINAKITQEIVFTHGTTDALNMLAHSLIPNRKKIILTELEHHSNLIPWQEFAKRHSLTIEFIPLKGTDLDYDVDLKLIDPDTFLISFPYVSNAFGTIVDIEKLCTIAQSHNVISVVDGSQALSHVPIDVQHVNCDFFIGTSHKLFGPTGVGFMYGKYAHLEKMSPHRFGGNMISSVSYTDAQWSLPPYKFEAGTMPIAQVIGLGAAIDYILSIGGINAIQKQVSTVTQYAYELLSHIPSVTIISANIHTGIILFSVSNFGALDIATLLGEKGICIRAGHHCTMPLHNKLGLSATCRVSTHIYNEKTDIDMFIKNLKMVIHND